MKTIVFLLLLACAMPAAFAAEPTEIEVVADPRVYGEFPKNYKEIITQWLNDTLVDAPSAQIEWPAAPQPGSLPEKKGGKALFGYLVEFKVNSRNRFGTFTGMQKHTVLIRDGRVIKATGFGF
ncbi:MAG: hypothetical protein QOE26_2566 [Verrucomicrobiota bacterium]|jgi:hypothetical protein